MKKQSLAGKTIVVTRSPDRAGPFARLLRDRGARVVEFPTIEIIPPESWEDCDNAVRSLSSFDVVIWTSANAVRMFCDRMAITGFAMKSFEKPVMIAIGPATHHACKALGLIATTPAGDVQAEALALRLDFRGKRILFPKGDKALDRLPSILRGRDNVVTEVVVYRTQKPSQRDTEERWQQLKMRRVDALTFFSPSSFENLIDGREELILEQTVIAAIGPTTAQSIRDAGYRVDVVADKPDAAAMANALEEYFSKVKVS